LFASECHFGDLLASRSFRGQHICHRRRQKRLMKNYVEEGEEIFNQIGWRTRKMNIKGPVYFWGNDAMSTKFGAFFAGLGSTVVVHLDDSQEVRVRVSIASENFCPISNTTRSYLFVNFSTILFNKTK
jgi:hypothetical protein